LKNITSIICINYSISCLFNHSYNPDDGVNDF